MQLDEALRLVEAAGFTVTDDRRLSAYYAKQDARLSRLLERARRGDWVAAENLLRSTVPGHLPYSRPLSAFVDLIVGQLLSRKAITTARSGKRIANPLLAALLNTDSRKDYALSEKKIQLERLFRIHWKNGTQNELLRSRGESARWALIKFLAEGENIPPETLDKWLQQSGKNME